MKVTYNKKPCICGRDTDHEHKTLERYQLIEKDKEGVIVSEGYDHGYDGEDDHIYEKLARWKEEQKEAGDEPTFTSVRLIRVEQI